MITLIRSKISEFISQEVAEKVLHRYLNGTNKNRLKSCSTMKKLILIVRKAFTVHYTTYNIKAIIIGLRSVRFGSVIDKTETETDFRFGNRHLPKPIGFGN